MSDHDTREADEAYLWERIADLGKQLAEKAVEIAKLKQERDEVLAWAKYWVAYTPKEITVRELGYRDAALEISKRLSKSDPTEGK
jgi:hypothetical protein